MEDMGPFLLVVVLGGFESKFVHNPGKIDCGDECLSTNPLLLNRPLQ